MSNIDQQKTKAKAKNIKFSEHATAHLTVFVEKHHTIGMVKSPGYFNFVWRNLPKLARVEVIHESLDFEMELRITKSDPTGVNFLILSEHVWNEVVDEEKLPRVEHTEETDWRVLDKDGRVIGQGLETREAAIEFMKRELGEE
jgi:hypothetical protein